MGMDGHNKVAKLDFSWRADVTGCKGSDMSIGSVRAVTYKVKGMKKTTQTKQIMGMDGHNKVAIWECIASEPKVSFTSARYSVQLHEITMTGETLAVFTTVYSNDATIEVTTDQKYKLRDGLTGLANMFTKKSDK